MTKSVRFLIVSIIFFVMVIFSWKNDSHSMVAGKTISAFRVESTVAVASTDYSPPRQKLILLEFFSGF